MPLIQSSAFRLRGIGAPDWGAGASNSDSGTLAAVSSADLSAPETPFTAGDSEPSADSTAGLSCACICSFMLSRLPPAHGSGGVPVQFGPPLALLFSLSSPRRWPHTGARRPLAQGYELAW